ncbi:MAG: hypothetical protein OQJ89_03520 [Kangiellaceae bacterium]|nr:hypothetical protein [Kangiellaceae bacterium]MCW9016007.1 hypothetical protein [Kangiellaceae bacterium]
MYKIFAVLLLSVSISTSANETDQEEEQSRTEMEQKEENLSILQKLMETQYSCDRFPDCFGLEVDDPESEKSETDPSAPTESNNQSQSN